MKKIAMAATAVVAMALGATAPATAQSSRVEVGRLSCDVEGGVGLLIGSSKDMVCEFHRRNGRSEVYEGTIDKLGIDIGITGRTHIEWVVFSVRDRDVPRGSLAGTYVGASAEATVGVGLGGNWLVGGSRNGFALQPWSIQGQTGLNYSWTLTRLELY